MRLYTFTNMYLSSIQNGIQTAHIVSELFDKYKHNPNMVRPIYNWAHNYKTIIVLNGGFSIALESLCHVFNQESNEHPWASFIEGQDELNSSMTAVGIIIPEEIYNYIDELKNNDNTDPPLNLNYFDINLSKSIFSGRLAK